jgi:hypothetical protein
LQNVIGSLIDAIKTKNAHKALEWAKTAEWCTIEHFLVDGGSVLFLKENLILKI